MTLIDPINTNARLYPDIMTSNGSILFVSSGADIANPRSGEASRLQHLSEALTESWEVLGLVPSDVGCGDWFDACYRYDQWSLPFLTSLNPHFLWALGNVLTRHEVDVIHLSNGVCGARGISSIVDSGTKTIYAAQNVEADHAQDFVDPHLPNYKQILGPRVIPLIERAAVRCAHGVTTVSRRDRERFIEQYSVDTESIQSIPTGTKEVEESELEPREIIRARYDLSDGPIAVFHGYYGHPPNREAAKLIDEMIAPELQEGDMKIQFLLVGEGKLDVSSTNVRKVGFVEDLYSVLNAADFAVIPILHGGGTKTKVYDYVSLGLPIVSTPKGVEGIDLKNGEHVLVAEDVDREFVPSIKRIVNEDGLAIELRKRLNELAEEWNWERSAYRLEKFYTELSSA